MPMTRKYTRNVRSSPAKSKNQRVFVLIRQNIRLYRKNSQIFVYSLERTSQFLYLFLYFIFSCILTMPPSNKPGWVNWIQQPARAILIEDLEPGGYLDGKYDLTAEEVWPYYQNFTEFDKIVFSQFEERLKGHRKQATAARKMANRDERALEHDRKLYTQSEKIVVGSSFLICTQQRCCSEKISRMTSTKGSPFCFENDAGGVPANQKVYLQGSHLSRTGPAKNDQLVGR